MLIQIAAAAAGAAPKGAEYGLLPALRDGGIVTIATFSVMVLMSIGTLFIFFVKLYEQQKVLAQGKKIQASFWNNTSLQEAAAKVEKDTPYRQIVDDGLRAQEQHTLLADSQDQHDWTLVVMNRAKAAIDSKLKGGLSFLATVGSTAPFVGLFGTVMGILSALVKIGAAGQASIDTVAGPVGEALYMTAIGLGVAVPAVLAFNWLQARNKQISEEMTTFVNSIQAWMSSNGAVKPVVNRAAAARPAAAKPAAAKA
ncbi:MAG: MotA/TolQ/ExbB proton channel family protein [Sphingomonas sp.]